MLDKIIKWFTPVGEYTISKLLPMIALFALGVLAVQIVMRLIKKLLIKTNMEKAAHTLILTASRITSGSIKPG